MAEPHFNETVSETADKSPEENFCAIGIYTFSDKETHATPLHFKYVSSVPNFKALQAINITYAAEVMANTESPLIPVSSIWILPLMPSSNVFYTDICLVPGYSSGKPDPIAQALMNTLNFRTTTVFLGDDWRDVNDQTIQFFGHLFRNANDPQEQREFVESLGAALTKAAQSDY